MSESTRLGVCRSCKKPVRLEDDVIRDHKDNTGKRCEGSELEPVSDQWIADEEVKRIERLRGVIQELLTTAQKPPGLTTTVDLTRLYRRCSEVAETREFIEIMSGEHGLYIRNMPEEDYIEFERILREEDENVKR